MKQRLPLALSVAALLVAVFGATSIGNAAVHALLKPKTVAFAKRAGFAAKAGLANRAKVATRANTATTAGSANSATTAGSANTATTANNANSVNGIQASTTPTAGQLFPLGPDAKFPASVLPAAPPTSGWALTGNAGTSPATNFLGTTDAQPLVVKTNNAEAMRVTSSGDVGVGTAAPIAKLESNTTTDIALLGTSVSRGIVGRLGPATSCPGTYAVGGCGAATGNGVVGTATGGIGVLGDSTARGVVGTLGGTSCAGTYAVGGCGATTGNGVFGSSANGIGVLGDSTTRGVAGTLGATSCAGAYAVGGCAGSTVAAGVFGQSAATVALLAVTNTGNLFVGQAPEGANKARIDSTGKGFFNGGTQNSGADYAESIPIAGQAKLQPGDVLTVAAQHGFAVQRSRHRPSWPASIRRSRRCSPSAATGSTTRSRARHPLPWWESSQPRSARRTGRSARATC